MNVGFDFDRVFIDYPPFIPAKLIDWLYRNHKGKSLSYRIPRLRLEQFIREVSHFHLFRPRISENLEFVSRFPDGHHLHLISSRYKFLENLTRKLLDKSGLSRVFCSVNLNTRNEQPHFFKEKTIKRLKINLYVDDDLDLLKYLYSRCPRTKLFWYNPYGFRPPLPPKITSITKLAEIRNYLS